MSDLVEKTARAMCIANGGWPDEDMPNDGPRWKYWEPNARAAIAAVAEWLKEKNYKTTHVPDWHTVAQILRQLEQPK